MRKAPAGLQLKAPGRLSKGACQMSVDAAFVPGDRGMDFEGRTAIVTGGASGIGREIARRLASRQAAVAIADADADGARAVVDELAGEGLRAIAIGADVTRPEDVDRMVGTTVATYGQLDILVHSAGVGIERPFLETTLEEWQRVISVDLTGTFLCGQAAAREMVKARYGRIVNLSSTAGMRGGGRRAAYGAAKGGVITLTQVMAVELAERGITVNALAPGATETELVRRMHTAETRRLYTRSIPMNRYAEPSEVAAAALFLASEEAGYVTGHVLAVDGGFIAAGLIFRDDSPST